MTGNNLQHEEATRESETDDSPSRGIRVNVSITESDLEFLHQRAAKLRAETGRAVIPLGTAAYDVFITGRAAIELGRAS